MKKRILLAVFSFCALLGKSQYYNNPILSGFYPDPSICKANGEYYIVNSTFAYYPGLPIFHSKDLVNWELGGYALNTPAGLPLDGASVSEGLFAPTIRYDNGKFYVICTNVSGDGNFIVTADKIEGPWSPVNKLPEVNGIDPSLFFDGDSTYIVYNSIPPDNKTLWSGHRTIRLVSYDKKTGKVTSPNEIIVNGGTDTAIHPVWIEGPHLLKRGDWYYLICAQGGTGYNHTEVVFRSKSVHGPFIPFEHNPILTQKDLPRSRPNPITTTGHADFVEDNKGNWWATFLGCRPYEDDYYNEGRETFMAPVKWVNDWPIIDLGGKEVKYSYPIDAKRDPKMQVWNGNYTFLDQFDSKELNNRYAFLRTPSSQWYSLSEKKGYLALDLRPENCQGRHNPSFIGFRQAHLKGHAEIEFDFTAKAENEQAGFVLFQNESHYYAFVKSIKNGKPVLQLWKGDGSKPARPDGTPTLIAEKTLSSKTSHITLNIEAKDSLYNFSYKETLKPWQSFAQNINGKWLSTYEAGGFVGCMYAMYASSNGQPSTNKAYFNSFRAVNNDDVYYKK